jgi:hypothetical protein
MRRVFSSEELEMTVNRYRVSSWNGEHILKLIVVPDVVFTSVILALERQRQEDHKFEASLEYTVSSRPI